ncbi:MAG: helix-turn-helix domain-containing protein [Candidatus Aenigmatarchaeota archaeon]|nr:MAG: helix-turn-helix domain-containing protein [Candidatus Aenigmarchaeota archaeon]
MVHIEGVILDILKKSDISLTINEVAEKANTHRTTASKYLAVLEAKGMLKCRNVGKAKLYSLNDVVIRVKGVKE